MNKKEEKMKPVKYGVILLALLLAGMIMGPIVSAQSTDPGVTTKNLSPCEGAKITGANPETDLGVGGMLTTKNAVSSQLNHRTLFDDFGLQKPEIVKNAPPFKSYNESREISDKIMGAAKLTDSTNAIIGSYDFGSYQILLINRDPSVLELVYDGKSIKTYSLTPRLLGTEVNSEVVQVQLAKEARENNYSVETTTLTKLYQVSIISPGTKVTPMDTYIVKKNRTDVFRNVLQQTIATLHTEGWFYVNYGVSITSIQDYSSWSISSSFPGWRECEYTTQLTGIGTTSGKDSVHFKFGSFTDRCQMDMWVSCDAWLTANDGGTSNRWTSVSPDGCIG
jgi:hypothetical protein